MRLEISAPNGNCGYVDNQGQVNGQVKITGHEDMVRFLDSLINHDYQIPKIMAAAVMAKYPAEILKINDNKLLEIQKASDQYLRNFFIPLINSSFGFTAKEC